MNLCDSDDTALRDRILRGDRAAAESLFERNLDSLYEFVHYRVGGETQVAEDIVQDTFLVAVENLEGFDGRSTLYTWLCGIARNKIREHRRRRRRRPMRLDELLLESDAEIETILCSIEERDLPDWVLQEKETRELVGATLASLPPDYRRALLDKYVDELPVTRIAERSGKGSKATESMLHRARQAFSRVFCLLAKRRGGLEE